MNAQAKYGVLLITGDQTHQENYAAGFAADPRCRIVAVTDGPGIDRRREQLNRRTADRFNVPYEGDLAKALALRDVSVVSNCAPPDRRGPIAVAAAEAGKHLYLDKSLTPNLAEAHALVAAVKKAGVKSHMFSFVSAGWARRAIQFFESGALGELRSLHADCFFAKGRNGTVKPARRIKEEHPPLRQQLIEAKREFDNVGVYPIVFIHRLAGKRFKSVFAHTGNYFFAEHAKHDVEDFGLCVGTLEGGTAVTIAAGRYGWTSHPGFGTNRITVSGTQRTMTFDFNRPRLEIYNDDAPWIPPANPHPDDPMAFWSSTAEEAGAKPKKTWVATTPPAPTDQSYFIDCLEAGRDSEVNVNVAAHAADVLLACYKSAATGEPVAL